MFLLLRILDRWSISVSLNRMSQTSDSIAVERLNWLHFCLATQTIFDWWTTQQLIENENEKKMYENDQNH